MADERVRRLADAIRKVSELDLHCAMEVLQCIAAGHEADVVSGVPPLMLAALAALVHDPLVRAAVEEVRGG